MGKLSLSVNNLSLKIEGLELYDTSEIANGIKKWLEINDVITYNELDDTIYKLIKKQLGLHSETSIKLDYNIKMELELNSKKD